MLLVVRPSSQQLGLDSRQTVLVVEWGKLSISLSVSVLWWIGMSPTPHILRRSSRLKPNSTKLVGGRSLSQMALTSIGKHRGCGGSRGGHLSLSASASHGGGRSGTITRMVWRFKGSRRQRHGSFNWWLRWPHNKRLTLRRFYLSRRRMELGGGMPWRKGATTDMLNGSFPGPHPKNYG